MQAPIPTSGSVGNLHASAVATATAAAAKLAANPQLAQVCTRRAWAYSQSMGMVGAWPQSVERLAFILKTSTTGVW